MMDIKKLGSLQRRIIILRLLSHSQEKRANYLKKKNIFYKFGEKVKWAPSTIPAEPYLVSIANNVKIAANVTFVTHDIISGLFNSDPTLEGKYSFYMGTIEVRDNVMIGSNSTILYNTKIGPNAIVAAGSVVTKDVPEGTIVAGNPARVIGSYSDLAKRRALFHKPDNSETIESILNAYWGN